MRVKNNIDISSQSGTSLFELLIACAIITVVVTSLSMFFHRYSRISVVGRQEWQGSAVASSKLQQIRQLPYALVPTTGGLLDQTGANVNAVFSNYPTTCDCTSADFTQVPKVDSVTVQGVTYFLSYCINLVEWAGANQVNHCPVDADTGLKKIRVQASWSVGSQTQVSQIEGMVSR